MSDEPYRQTVNIPPSKKGCKMAYTALKCQRPFCGNIFEAETFKTECPRCKRTKLALQKTCRERGAKFTISMLYLANKLRPAFQKP